MVSEKDVLRAVYRGAFGKYPSETFMRTQAEALQSGVSLDALIQRIFESQAFSNMRARKAQQESRAIYHMPRLPRDDRTLAALFDRTAHYWRNEASRDNEIYYSVVSSTANKNVLTDEERQAFLQSGKDFIERCRRIIAPHINADISNLTALDFGCGVGRLALNAARHFAKVYAVDFSSRHLRELGRNQDDMFPEAHARVETVLIERWNDVASLPKVEVVYSLIVLQHNTPPMIAYLLRNLLYALKVDGVAAIHVPLYIPYYTFDTSRYLRDPQSGQRMEMHLLPKQNMREIAVECGCRLVDTFGMGSSKPYSELLIFKRLH